MYCNFNGSVVHIFLQLLQNTLLNICFKLHKNTLYDGALKAIWRTTFPSSRKSGIVLLLGSYIVLIGFYSLFFVLLCICKFVFGVGKDKKGTLLFKIMSDKK